jgi:hypothetical protein
VDLSEEGEPAAGRCKPEHAILNPTIAVEEGRLRNKLSSDLHFGFASFWFSGILVGAPGLEPGTR